MSNVYCYDVTYALFDKDKCSHVIHCVWGAGGGVEKNTK